LRNSWYLQLYVGDLPGTLKRGTTVGYTNLTPEAHWDALVAAGLPEDDADVIVDSDQAIPRGELETTSHDLSRLIHRPATSVTEFLTGRLHPDGQGRGRL
jgi:NAD(P)H dehydrogenase (quinone)